MSVERTSDAVASGVSPKEAGFELPAEWEPQAAVWLAWPVSKHIWPQHRAEIQNKFAEIAARISWYEPVCINAAPSEHAAITAALNRARCDLTVTRLWAHPTDDVWCRDFGPLFLKNRANGNLAVADFEFNAWGGKFEQYQLDNAVPEQIAAAMGLQRFARGAVLEGGAIESNGTGCILTTEAVLLNSNRYARPSRASAEALLCDGLGASEVVWLKQGIDHDDTDGHIDNVTRFIAADSVVTVVDPTQPQLLDNAAVLRRRFANVLTLPLPEVLVHEGRPLPASYANFLILNDAVLLPVFGQSGRDQIADGVMRDCFPGRKIEAVDARLLLLEGGAVHCLSMQQQL